MRLHWNLILVLHLRHKIYFRHICTFYLCYYRLELIPFQWCSLSPIISNLNYYFQFELKPKTLPQSVQRVQGLVIQTPNLWLQDDIIKIASEVLSRRQDKWNLKISLHVNLYMIWHVVMIHYKSKKKILPYWLALAFFISVDLSNDKRRNLCEVALYEQ